MRRRAFPLGIIATVAVLLLFLMVGKRMPRAGSNNFSTRSLAHPRVEIVRVKPPVEKTDVVECASLAFAEFTYRVSNRADAPIKGLRVGTTCACEAIGTSPTRILPAGSALISFRVRAPRVGRLERKIPLLVDGASQPIAMLDGSVRVKFDPPALIPPPNGLSLTFIDGKTSKRELAFDAIEAKRADNWICGVELEPPGSIDVRPFVVENLPEVDPDLIRRRYRFSLVNRALSVGRCTVTATIKTRDGSPAVESPLVIGIDVTDSVALVPNPLIIKFRQGETVSPRRVCVVNRTGGAAAAAPIEYDDELLHVDAAAQQTGSVAAFDVVPLKMPESALETQVVFRIGDTQTRVLAVRFEPAERH